MKYPSYNVKGINTVDSIVRTGHFLESIYIKPNLKPGSFFIDGCTQIVTEKINPLFPIITEDEFYKIYKDFYYNMVDFFMNLKCGDTLVVEERRGEEGLYPFGFIDEMVPFVGQKVTIKQIMPSSYGRNCPYYNGVDLEIRIEEDHGRFGWHPSMFEVEKSTSVKIINITPLNLDF